MLVDEVTIKVRGGKGGAGRVAFYPNRGKPCGGDGGSGGNVFAKIKPELTSLFRYLQDREFEASKGRDGESLGRKGTSGEDLTLLFPNGTQLEDLETGEVIELKGDEPVLLVKGASGGYGNIRMSRIYPGIFAKANDGRKGASRTFRATMRLIADCGFIGLPNAGKSSLLNALTNAGARVADYPFTTIDPNLGVIQIPSSKDRVILADIPGLIEGASLGKGLGTKFLKHVEKVGFFVHCISSESKDIKGDYEMVRRELGDYNERLLEKPEIILITKSDLIEDKNKKVIKEKIEKELGKEIFFCSVINDEELQNVKDLIIKKGNG